MISKNTAYLSRLDHLRFFAALLVAVYHFHRYLMPDLSLNPILMFIREGETGVSLFMVLSGFILTRIAYGKEIDYRSFVYNRLLRIYPLYLTAVLVIAYSGNRNTDFLSLLQMLTPFANAGAILGASKFPHIWTIAVEFQFYLAFPFLVAALKKQHTSYIFGLVAMAVLIRVILFINDGTVQDAAYSTIIGRFDQFVIGMGAALLYAARPRLLASPLALTGAVVGVYAWFYVFTAWTHGGYYGTNAGSSIAWVFSPAIEAAVWAALMLAYLEQSWKMPSLADKTLAYLGSTSFSMYIWHYPIILLFRKHPEVSITGIWYIDFILMVLPTILIISSLSFHVIEKPFFAFRTPYLKRTDFSQADKDQIKPKAEPAKMD